jgi:hypothetical protein
MRENLRLLRFFFVLLGIFTIGRWAMGLSGVPYQDGHQVFSIVTLTAIASVHHAAFARRYYGYRLGAALGLVATLAVSAQLVILLSTFLSYLFGVESYFNHPRALNVAEAIPMAQAMTARGFGLVVNTVINVVVGALGYLMGALLPTSSR